MADIKLNFSSQWPSMQVAMVIDSTTPKDSNGRVAHNLGYPPLAISMGDLLDTMSATTVSDTHIYPDAETVVVYAVDISQDYNYSEYTSQVGNVLKDTSTTKLDLRKFLLHSRAISPMLLNVKTKTYTTSDTTLNYTHPLNYPIFNFGYVRMTTTTGGFVAGTWCGAPLQSQSWPMLVTDGFSATLATTTINGNLQANRGSIITLRNPAIVTNNTVTVNV